MSELAREYEGKVQFTVTPVVSAEGAAAKETYDFGQAGHGLVCFDANGNVAEVIPGHDYGKGDIEFEIEQLLK